MIDSVKKRREEYMCDFVRERETEAVSLEISLTLFRAELELLEGPINGQTLYTSTSHTERDDDQQPKTKVVLKKTECKYLKKKSLYEIKIHTMHKNLTVYNSTVPIITKRKKEIYWQYLNEWMTHLLYYNGCFTSARPFEELFKARNRVMFSPWLLPHVSRLMQWSASFI